MSKALFYFAVLTALLILVAYYVGSTALGQTVGTQAGKLLLFAQGRNLQGNFAAYPGNAGVLPQQQGTVVL